MTIDTRDKARELIAAAGITTANVTEEQLAALQEHINARMVESGNYRGSYRMNDEVSPYMTCRTDQWDAREAVSFNRDGFIGLAGWADNDNIKPILLGIGDWLGNYRA
ncbi:MAG: hypothetical protein ACXWT1_05660 [Methylobacter sp.]